MFSFNSPYGACPACDGLGSTMEVDPNIIVPDKSKSLLQGAIAPLGEQPRDNWYGSVLRSLARYYDFNFTTPWINQARLFGGSCYLVLVMTKLRWNTDLGNGQVHIPVVGKVR